MPRSQKLILVLIFFLSLIAYPNNATSAPSRGETKIEAYLPPTPIASACQQTMENAEANHVRNETCNTFSHHLHPIHYQMEELVACYDNPEVFLRIWDEDVLLTLLDFHLWDVIAEKLSIDIDEAMKTTSDFRDLAITMTVANKIFVEQLEDLIRLRGLNGRPHQLLKALRKFMTAHHLWYDTRMDISEKFEARWQEIEHRDPHDN